MTRNLGEIEISITKVELTHTTNLGVWLGSIIHGNIPIYEEHLSRVERGISLSSWSEMDMDEKAMIIAIRRLQRTMDNLQSEAEAIKAEKK